MVPLAKLSHLSELKTDLTLLKLFPVGYVLKFHFIGLQFAKLCSLQYESDWDRKAKGELHCKENTLHIESCAI